MSSSCRAQCPICPGRSLPGLHGSIEASRSSATISTCVGVAYVAGARHGRAEAPWLDIGLKNSLVYRSTIVGDPRPRRLRTLLITGSRSTPVRFLPLMLILGPAGEPLPILAGRRRQAVDVIGAIGWNISHLGDIRTRRKALAAIRQIPDSEVRALQAGGSARVSSFLRNQLGGSQGKVLGFFGGAKLTLDEDDAGIVRDGFLLLSFTSLMILFGSRHLLTRAIEPVGLIPDLQAGAFSEWWGGWRGVGVGGAGHAPTALIVLSVVKTVLLGSCVTAVPDCAGCGPVHRWFIRDVAPGSPIRESSGCGRVNHGLRLHPTHSRHHGQCPLGCPRHLGCRAILACHSSGCRAPSRLGRGQTAPVRAWCHAKPGFDWFAGVCWSP
ncbi:MAG: hypothetical protein R2706_09795 [Acidimicrobiales bacterium]